MVKGRWPDGRWPGWAIVAASRHPRDDWDFDLEDWYALEYYNPILYVEEEGWLADIFVQGVGFICPPLSVGEHTLHLDEVWPAFGVTYDNTWNITVVYGGG